MKVNMWRESISSYFVLTIQNPNLPLILRLNPTSAYLHHRQ